ncbi:cbb3-type cytochrome oxidase assembly protein CcoS [Roseovarius sp. D0-M9]|uniref:cbb3-type cytochrome oxidase assembly protein CcoS n=1 Tax=Roseovarius sp. D0-M9 TaxID=3127117 RepID=UPI00300F7BC5
MGLIGLGVFVWALRNDQFEDLEGNSHRVLLQSAPPGTKEEPNDKMTDHSEHSDA